MSSDDDDARGERVTGNREARVLNAVVTLVDNMLDDFDLVELLTDLTEQCTDLLDVASAGLLLTDARRNLHVMAATSDRTEELELFQLQADEGPCLDCFASGEPVSVADLSEATQRWPRFVAAARGAGFASVHAVPMKAAGTPLGALGLFGTSVGQLNDADLLVGRSLAHVASVAIVQERPPSQDTVLFSLNKALANRVTIEQAKGFVRERLDVSIAEASALLREHARRTGGHLTDVAMTLMSEPEARSSLLQKLRDIADERSTR